MDKPQQESIDQRNERITEKRQKDYERSELKKRLPATVGKTLLASLTVTGALALQVKQDSQTTITPGPADIKLAAQEKRMRSERVAEFGNNIFNLYKDAREDTRPLSDAEIEKFLREVTLPQLDRYTTFQLPEERPEYEKIIRKGSILSSTEKAMYTELMVLYADKDGKPLPEDPFVSALRASNHLMEPTQVAILGKILFRAGQLGPEQGSRLIKMVYDNCPVAEKISFINNYTHSQKPSSPVTFRTVLGMGINAGDKPECSIRPWSRDVLNALEPQINAAWNKASLSTGIVR